MMVPRESFRRKKSGYRHQKKSNDAHKKNSLKCGENKKKGSWEQAAVA